MKKSSGKITIELVKDHVSDTGSSLPNLGHVAYQLMKLIPEIDYKDANGNFHPLGEHFQITHISTEQFERKVTK